MRALAQLAVLSALALAAVGCGGGTEAGAGGDAAAIVPADVALYVSGNTDFDSAQWQAVEDLFAKFPDGDRAIAQLKSELESEEGVDFEQDVKPALGPEVAFVLLEIPTGGADPPFVAMTQPQDAQKLEALLEKGQDPAVSEQVDGWTLVSDKQESIDRFKEMQGDSALADADTFASAFDGLDGDSLVSFYLNGETLEKAAASDPSLDRAQLDALTGGKLEAIGAIARAEDNGARIEGQAVFSEDAEGTAFGTSSFDATLPDEVPAGVLAYVGFSDLEQQISTFRDALAEADPTFESQLGQAEAALGVSIEEDIAPLFAGEGAVYVRGGGLIPEVTLVTKVDDEEKALATLDDLVDGLGAFAPIAKPTTVEIEGVQAREVAVQAPVSLFYAAFDGKLVVTSARSGIADLRGGDHLAGDEAFKAAKDAAGMPDETTGFAYVNLHDVIPLVLGFAGAATDVPPEVSANTEPLRSLVAWGSVDGKSARFDVFVGIE